MNLRKSKYVHTFVYEIVHTFVYEIVHTFVYKIVLTLYVILWQVFASLLMMKLSILFK
jgi:hypothetical protein